MAPKGLFSRIKILGESTWSVLYFLQRPKVSPNVKVPIEKIWKTTFPMPCARAIHSRDEPHHMDFINNFAEFHLMSKNGIDFCSGQSRSVRSTDRPTPPVPPEKQRTPLLQGRLGGLRNPRQHLHSPAHDHSGNPPGVHTAARWPPGRLVTLHPPAHRIAARLLPRRHPFGHGGSFSRHPWKRHDQYRHNDRHSGSRCLSGPAAVRESNYEPTRQ